MENDQNRINNTSPLFKAPLEPIMEDETLSSMAPHLTVAIPAIPISTVPATARPRGRSRATSPRRPRTTNPILAPIRGIAMSGQNLKPHRITIYRAQDVVEKIVAFCKGHRGAVVLSASGNAIISSVTLRGSNSPLEITLEGRFEILSLAGRFIENETEGRLHLTISLVLQDMSVIGGIITGPLIAASAMNILMGTFNPPTSNPQADIIPLATNLNISEPSSSNFDASASCSNSNKKN
ncbi:unnamed protein product [Citrullus colocynthis]|uniref:AT-hook motif nuclear-localized protein n=1 Tax=Citrullus colocynthis TaxID=252529 RepID=A0ABP0YNL0_9ROSI